MIHAFSAIALPCIITWRPRDSSRHPKKSALGVEGPPRLTRRLSALPIVRRSIQIGSGQPTDLAPSAIYKLIAPQMNAGSIHIFRCIHRPCRKLRDTQAVQELVDTIVVDPRPGGIEERYHF